MTARTHGPTTGVAALLLTLTLAACGSDADASDDVGQGVRCPETSLVTMSALTGPDSGLGKAIARGAGLALTEFTDANPECDLHLDRVDTQGLPERATTAARRIVRDAEIVGVVGPAFSGEALAAGTILDDAGVPFVTPSATNPALSKRGWTTFHRVPASDAVLGAATATVIRERADGGRVVDRDDPDDPPPVVHDRHREQVVVGDHLGHLGLVGHAPTARNHQGAPL